MEVPSVKDGGSSKNKWGEEKQREKERDRDRDTKVCHCINSQRVKGTDMS